MSPYRIIWTKTDEAPELASAALLPIVRSYLKHADIDIDLYDISLSGRILANFPDALTEDQHIPDHLTELGKRVNEPDTNIIKLPNISASLPQLQAAIRELQNQGYNLPDYPESPKTPEEKNIRERYAKVLGSAVNPVLREGNSDRRAAASVKSYALKTPHKMMKPWPESESVTRVAHMTEKDFFGTEQAVTMEKSCRISVEFHGSDGQKKVLKKDLALLEGEVLDSAVMNIGALREFYADTLTAAKEENALFSLHLKATMMKVSDPILFGHCVSVFFHALFQQFGETLEKIGVNVNNGVADIMEKIRQLPEASRLEIEEKIRKIYKEQPALAMVDSDNGITNLHLPNNVIIDASMPNVIRDGGRMWNPDGRLQDTIAVIPDRSYATIYQTVIADCQSRGQFDPSTMGSVSNVGLMAKKAEEYGSHDKTFEAPGNGTIRVMDETGACLMEQDVEKGDIFRMCQTKDVAIRDWVKLGVDRARAAGSPAIFWLNPHRGHDRELIKKVERYLNDHDTSGIDVQIMEPDAAMQTSLDRVRQGKDTIAVTGNVLRDYLTDLFPILELGTSSRMLSIVPLLNGGGLFETGAGGSAPKHVQQFLKEGHLRWDSLGEYCALVPSLEQIATASGNAKAAIFAKALDRAIGMYLENEKSPSRKVHEIDNRGATFYVALYWARSLADQTEDESIGSAFAPMADALESKTAIIDQELLDAQGSSVDIGGYFHPDPHKVNQAMRPSPTLNQLIDR